MSSVVAHERDVDGEDAERYSKRTKLDDDVEMQFEEKAKVDQILPPSHSLLGLSAPEVSPEGKVNFFETDVGISEYVGRGVSKIEGIIKQRFTDFLVFEVDQDGNTIHIKSLAMPESVKAPQPETTTVPTTEDVSMEVDEVSKSDETSTTAEKAELIPESKVEVPWAEQLNSRLSQYFSESSLEQLKQMFSEGPEPPRVSDSGWGGRQVKTESSPTDETPAVVGAEADASSSSKRGKDKGGRGSRGGRGGRRGGRGGSGREDNRRVISNPILAKEDRTALHQAVRELFKGKLDTETDTAAAPNGEIGSTIVVKWSRSGGGRGGRGGRGSGSRSDQPSRGNFPPYIHFTLQKTNRDTQDALSHLSRILHVNVKDLSVAGTKDKRGVTVQRVALRRLGKTVEDIWKLANGQGKRAYDQALKQRADRGVRIADLNYRKAALELGMLKGNAFVITLRNVQVDSMDTLDKALNTIKTYGFINYYGMQRFGTASVPTHAIGLALLLSQWDKAVSLILRPRHGEHPDVDAARKAWLVDKDLDKALALMPRRVVAERCILESYKKQGGDTRNAMGSLSTIPRNLRLMYVHAYQSYVWNAIVSERVRNFGTDKPIVGDLVFGEEPDKEVDDDVTSLEEKDEDEKDEPAALSRDRKKSKKPWVPPKVKTLTEEDVDKHSIFDVIMPLPGTDVSYPGGKLGARYREFLTMDGLDPDNFVRKQKDYTLGGSYRKILHLPKEMSWSVIRYTDPDVALAQADEDKLLGFDPPCITEDGKFLALQIELTLGTAAYATMALREITKTETSSHFQTNLTIASEDQKYRGGEEQKEAPEEILPTEEPAE